MKILLTTVQGLEDLVLQEIFSLLAVNEILSYRTLEYKGRIYLDVRDEKITDFLGELMFKSRLIDHVYLIILEKRLDNISRINNFVQEFFVKHLKDFLNQYTFYAVSSQRLEKRWEITSVQLSKNIGEIIDNLNVFLSPISLDDPDLVVYAELKRDSICLGFNLTFNTPLHRRSYRRYIHPSMINPILASALCYLSKIEKRRKILDPFCGSGTILIECKKINPECICYGYDINPKHVNGAKQNIIEAGVDDIYVGVSDILELDKKLDNIDAIITNPPFGIREEAIGGINRVYKYLFDLSVKILNENGVLTIITPRSNIIRRLIKKYNKYFRLLNLRRIYEGGLEANIYVLERK